MNTVANDDLTDRLPRLHAWMGSDLVAQVQLISAEHSTLEGRCGKAIDAILKAKTFKINKSWLTNEQKACLFRPNNDLNVKLVQKLLMLDQLVRQSGDDPLIAYTGRIHPGKAVGWCYTLLRRHLDAFAGLRSWRRPGFAPKPSGMGQILKNPPSWADSTSKESMETIAVMRRFSLLNHQLQGTDVNDYVWTNDHVQKDKWNVYRVESESLSTYHLTCRVAEPVTKLEEQRFTAVESNEFRSREGYPLKSSKVHDLRPDAPDLPELRQRILRKRALMRLRPLIFNVSKAYIERVNKESSIEEIHTTIVRTWFAFERWHEEWKTLHGEEIFFTRLPLFADEPLFIVGYDE